MGPFTSWPSSKGKKAKKLSAALTKRLVFAVPTRAEILFFGAWPPFAASFLLVHVISKAIQSTFDISRPQHHRPVSNWPIGFFGAELSVWQLPMATTDSYRYIAAPCASIDYRRST